jgi:uncharacterized repeat protein (TIGR02543 family)
MKKLFYLLLLLLPCIVKAEITNFTISSTGELCATYSGSGQPTNYRVGLYDMDYQFSLNGQVLSYSYKEVGTGNCFDLTAMRQYNAEGSHNYKYVFDAIIVVNDDYANPTIVDSDYKVVNTNNGVFTVLQPHTVRFHLNGGSWPTDNNPNVDKPADEMDIYEFQTLRVANYNFRPVKDNNIFKGWYLEEDFSGNNQYSITGINKDIDLYARWVSKDTKYAVRFEDENGNLIEEKRILVETEIKEMDAPVKDGYKFFSWCIYEGNECEAIDVRTYIVEEDLVLRPKYVNNNKAISDVNIYIRAPRIGDVYTIEEIPKAGLIQNPKVYVQSLTDNVGIDWIEFYSNDSEGLFSGTVLKDTDYEYYLIFEIPEELEDDYTFVNSQVMNVVINGKNIDHKDLSCYYSSKVGSGPTESYNYCELYTRIPSTDEKYAIMNGHNQKLNKNSDLVIRIDGDIDGFKELVVDGKVVDSNYYKLTVGSTIVTLDKSYLESLEDGDHEIKVVYNDGDVSTSFNINDDTKPVVDAVANNIEENPFTADAILITVIGLSISLLTFGYFFRKKHFIDKERKEFLL